MDVPRCIENMLVLVSLDVASVSGTLFLTETNSYGTSRLDLLLYINLTIKDHKTFLLPLPLLFLYNFFISNSNSYSYLHFLHNVQPRSLEALGGPEAPATR